MENNKKLSQMTKEELLDYLHNTAEGQKIVQDIKEIMKKKSIKPKTENELTNEERK